MPKTVPCPYCTESTPNDKGMFVIDTGRAFVEITGWFQRTLGIRLPTSLINYFKERLPRPKADCLKECGYCKNERVIEDPNDDSAEEQQSASALAGKADEISKNEALMGMGGHIIFKSAGDVFLKAGHTLNTTPSYRIDHCTQPVPKGLAGGQDITDEGSCGVIMGDAGPNIKRFNIPSGPGGTVNIVGGNGIALMAGSPRGIELQTSGHCSINAPTTELIASSLTLGSDDGQTTISGKSLIANAGHIVLGTNAASDPSDVVVRGSFSSTGQVRSGGFVYGEGGAFCHMKLPSKKEYIDGGSGTNTYGGPGFWGGPAAEGIIAGNRQVLSYAIMQGPAHPKFLQQITSPRYYLGISDSVINAAYTARPVELIPTGVTVVAGFLPSLVWNWPHIHAVPDDAHVHSHTTADIELYDDAKAIRKAVPRTSAPQTAKKTSLGEVLLDLISGIPTLISGAGNQQGNMIK